MLKLNPHHYQPKVPWQPMTYRHCWCPRSLIMCHFFCMSIHIRSKTVHRSPTWQVICSSAVETNNGNSCLDSWLQHHHLTTLGQRLCNLTITVKTLDDLQTGLGMLSHQTLLPTTVIWPAMHIVSLDLHPFLIVYNDSGLVFFLDNLQHLRNYNHWSGDHMRHMTELAGHCIQDSHFVASSHLTKPSIDFADISEPWFHFAHSKVHTWQTWDTWLVATWLTWLGLNLTTWSLTWTCCFSNIIIWGNVMHWENCWSCLTWHSPVILLHLLLHLQENTAVGKDQLAIAWATGDWSAAKCYKVQWWPNCFIKIGETVLLYNQESNMKHLTFRWIVTWHSCPHLTIERNIHGEVECLSGEESEGFENTWHLRCFMWCFKSLMHQLYGGESEWPHSTWWAQAEVGHPALLHNRSSFCEWAWWHLNWALHGRA